MTEARIEAALGEVPDDERFCASCGKPVGRPAAGRPGRVKGFCGSCRTPFDFVTNRPTLRAGDRVAGQYEIVGPLAHGGLGWIYLARDNAVSNRWVVLKGLLNSQDPDAVAAAVAERQFLARMDHGNIVRIYNFVTHAGAGYIVMEYVGGESLNSILKARRAANGNRPDPLPVAQAIAYILATLPAISYLHKLGLVYNDLKPANIMAVGEDVKLIDLGAVMRVDDAAAAIFGTDGFQAPEVAEMGVSVSSDLYTVGRTLAVLILNFVFHDGEYKFTLPPAESEPLFARWESLHRFLLKATATHPDDRFQTADEMGDQLLGVLREMVALEEGQPRPAQSASFGTDLLAAVAAQDGALPGADWRLLPALRVDPADPAAAFLVNLPPTDGATAASALSAAVAQGQIPDTIEVQFRQARALLDAGSFAEAEGVLAGIEAVDPWDWRVDWSRGLSSLARGDAGDALARFNRVWTDVPGELAPKLALALAAEHGGQLDAASHLFDLVSRVDLSFTTAIFGLARCRAAAGDRAGAVEAYRRVPQTSSMYVEAQSAVARALIAPVGGAAPGTDELVEAGRVLERLPLDGEQRAALSREVLEAALGLFERGTLPPQAGVTVLGRPLQEHDLRLGLERSYRELARLADDPTERDELVDHANAVRPKTWL
jgi:serine/threonine-protein kinase PknG